MALSHVSHCDLLKDLDESKGVDLDTNQELCQATDSSFLMNPLTFFSLGGQSALNSKYGGF